MKLLALDFDGVISDSATESFVIALRTLGEMQGLAERVDEAEAIFDEGPDRARAHPWFGHFIAHLPLSNRAEDFGILLVTARRGQILEDQAAYDRVLAAHSEAFLASYHARFYENRRLLRERDLDRWLRLLGPYPAFIEILRRISRRVVLTLATAKDRASVTRLLDAYGIAEHLPDERVIDKEAGRSKVAHLRVTSERFGVPMEEITFVDDKVNHLEGVAALGVRCGLASWGYNGEREATRARELGFLVLELRDFERALFSDAR